MSTIGIILSAIMVISTTISIFFIILWESKAPVVLDVSSYNDSVNDILNADYSNEGEILTQRSLLENTDYVLSALKLRDVPNQ